ncbi:MAG: hypothetical protein Tsb0015_09220 [Simkaniaceae bacterium]
MVRLIFLIILMCFGSCMNQSTLEIGKGTRLKNQLLARFAKKMQAEEIYACGGGGRVDHGIIREIDIVFDIKGSFNLEEARKLIVKISTLFLEEINQDEAIREYLICHPFTSKSILVAILAKRPLDESKDYVISLRLRDGIVSYRKEDPEKVRYVTFCEENFEDALEKVSSSKL